MEKRKIIQIAEYEKTKRPTGGSPEQKREYCVVCGKPTAYFFDTPVEEREHFILGSGQLCPDCFAEIYGKI